MLYCYKSARWLWRFDNKQGMGESDRPYINWRGLPDSQTNRLETARLPWNMSMLDLLTCRESLLVTSMSWKGSILLRFSPRPLVPQPRSSFQLYFLRWSSRGWGMCRQFCLFVNKHRWQSFWLNTFSKSIHVLGLAMHLDANILQQAEISGFSYTQQSIIPTKSFSARFSSRVSPQEVKSLKSFSPVYHKTLLVQLPLQPVLRS